jgi:hypothetical protein
LPQKSADLPCEKVENEKRNLEVNVETPLSYEQVTAANRLRKHLHQWRLSEEALFNLQKRIPQFDLEACLLKSVSVNALYGTNVLAIIRMANHVHKVLHKKADPSDFGRELVKNIAEMPNDKGERDRTRTSFASKFCHFFIDSDQFPIYDDAACVALKSHFGKRVEAHDYDAFCNCIKQLTNLVGNGCDTRMIDHYLWLTGMYQRWIRNKSNVNRELFDLFNNLQAEQIKDMDIMLPNDVPRHFKVQV